MLRVADYSIGIGFRGPILRIQFSFSLLCHVNRARRAVVNM
jgi:hypothetical protein